MSAPNAQPTDTVLRTGRRRLLFGVLWSAVLIAFGLLAMLVAVNANTAAPVLLAAGFLLVCCAGAALLLVPAWKRRHDWLSVDTTGVWCCDCEEQRVIEWRQLSGVSAHWADGSRQTGRLPSHCIELWPSGQIDRDDAVLGRFVRDEEPAEPLGPELAALHYRIPLGRRGCDEVIDAVRRYAPQLWLGQVRGESRGTLPYE
ncbi:hypothetical protein AB0I53_32415 [Saccharopolyspora sp. NPDC050389]|uniref:hypothetical protein n=1 Tax=Saccharopolyspora sp. NPDC050389 TaxID=3155516 RepID=UPI0033EFEDDD